MSAEINIKISSNNSSPVVSLKHDDGVVKHKKVSIEDLISSLSKLGGTVTGILPPNTRWYDGKPNDYSVAIEVMPKVRDFYLYEPAVASIKTDYKPKHLKVPFPPLLFFFKVKNNKVLDCKLYAQVERIIKKNTSLYYFPFGNVYSDGRICWGSASVTDKIKETTHLIGVIDRFLNSSFNGDLISNNSYNKKYFPNCRYFWDVIYHLNGKTAFPLEALNKATTLNDVIAR